MGAVTSPSLLDHARLHFSAVKMSLAGVAEIIHRIIPEYGFSLIDIGAARFDDRRWKWLGNRLRVVGFEPQTEEFAKLQQTGGRQWINAALAASKGRRSLHLTEYWSNSSLLAPNARIVEELSTGSGYRVSRVETIDCQSMDEVMRSQQLGTDFLKIDTQGSELEILEGATEALKGVVCIEVEVEFLELYAKQPLFGDVARFLAEGGFILQDVGNFTYLKPRGYAGLGGPKGRLVFGDALFFRDPHRFAMEVLPQGEQKVLAAIAAYCAYGFPELGLVLLDAVEKHGQAFSMAEELRRQLVSARPRFSWVASLPGSAFLTKCGGAMQRLFVKPSHSLWWNSLGNRW